MKKWIIAGICVALFLAGVKYKLKPVSTQPDIAARAHVAELLAPLGASTDGLKFDVKKQSDASARVHISGKIAVDTGVDVVLDNGHWRVPSTGGVTTGH